MKDTPLFTRDELRAAFALVLPVDTARDLANEWWESFAGIEDEQGRFVYEGTWGPPRQIDDAPATDDPRWYSADVVTKRCSGQAPESLRLDA